MRIDDIINRLNLNRIMRGRKSFSMAEIEKLKEAGAECVTLGKRILRTETAGLCALVVTMSTFGEM